MSGIADAAISGAAHLICFTGTDTVPAIDLLEDYYYANSDSEIVGGSVAATEHSVMCMGSNEGELDTYRRLITEVYPTGIVSIVSDTWDYWNVITNTARTLKDTILQREGKLVFRPDSGNPVHIICGDPRAPEGSPQQKGTVECLYEIFGGTSHKAHNDWTFKALDPHVGAIYGDSITPDRGTAILEGLYNKGYVTGDVVLGLGSYGYQYVTRDTWGLAVKATAGVINGEKVELFKDPKTDGGDKKSARGLLRVVIDETGEYKLLDQQPMIGMDAMYEVFRDGNIMTRYTLAEIRQRVDREIERELAQMALGRK